MSADSYAIVIRADRMIMRLMRGDLTAMESSIRWLSLACKRTGYDFIVIGLDILLRRHA